MAPGAHANPQSLYSSRIGIHDFEIGAIWVMDDLSTRRNPSCQHEDEPAERVDFFLVFFVGQFLADFFLEFINRRSGKREVATRLFQRPVFVFFAVVFVLDLAR